VGPRAGLHAAEKRKLLTVSGLEHRPLGRPARSQSLYQLSYPGSFLFHVSFLLRRAFRRNEGEDGVLFITDYIHRVFHDFRA
jgi:hypothetical protein